MRIDDATFPTPLKTVILAKARTHGTLTSVNYFASSTKHAEVT
jgi:hypothetical protein